MAPQFYVNIAQKTWYIALTYFCTNAYYIVVALMLFGLRPYFLAQTHIWNDALQALSEYPITDIRFYNNTLVNASVCPSFGMENAYKNYTVRNFAFGGGNELRTFWDFNIMNGVPQELCVSRDQSYNYWTGINWNASNQAGVFVCNTGFKRCGTNNSQHQMCVPTAKTCPISDVFIDQNNNINVTYNPRKLPIAQFELFSQRPCLSNAVDFLQPQDNGSYWQQQWSVESQCNGGWGGGIVNVSNTVFWSANGISSDPMSAKFANSIPSVPSSYQFTLYSRPYFSLNPTCNQTAMAIPFWQQHVIVAGYIQLIVATLVAIILSCLRAVYQSRVFNGKDFKCGKVWTLLSFLVHQYLYCVQVYIFAYGMWTYQYNTDFANSNCSSNIDIMTFVSNGQTLWTYGWRVILATFVISTYYEVVGIFTFVMLICASPTPSDPSKAGAKPIDNKDVAPAAGPDAATKA